MARTFPPPSLGYRLRRGIQVSPRDSSLCTSTRSNFLLRCLSIMSGCTSYQTSTASRATHKTTPPPSTSTTTPTCTLTPTIAFSPRTCTSGLRTAWWKPAEQQHGRPMYVAPLFCCVGEASTPPMLREWFSFVPFFLDPVCYIHSRAFGSSWHFLRPHTSWLFLSFTFFFLVFYQLGRCCFGHRTYIHT